METVLLRAGTLSQFIVINATDYVGQGYASLKGNGYVGLGERDVFSVFVKIEAERATSNDRYVHLRFCHTNRYWERRGFGIVTESNKPEEDTTKSSCTLFEAVKVDGGDGRRFYLRHVQSGATLWLDRDMNFYARESIQHYDYLTFVNWEDLVKLPRNVAFKGDNDEYLRGIVLQSYNYLQFSSKDPNASTSIHEVHLMNDGHVRIKSRHFDRFWRRSPNWIWGDSTDTTANNRDTLFWPVKIDETTIALRNAGNNQFCKRLTAEGKESCLNAAENTVTTEARLTVQELVLGRRIYNVRYWVENSRIFNESPFLAGTTTAFNYSDSEAGIAVEVSYEDSKSQTFSHSYSLTLGTEIEFTAGIPLIASSTVTVSAEINTTLEWSKTTTTTVGVKATGSVPVPPRSKATVSYVGTVGTCDVPFSYTQQARRSTDGTNEITQHVDGVFRGVNNYNFSFVVEKHEPL